MISIECRQRQGKLCGFLIEGHAGMGVAGEDIVCAAVSSAAYLTANTITEILHLDADITVEDGHMEVMLPSASADVAQTVLLGFRLHVQAMQEQYPQRVQVMNTEV